MHYSTIGCYIVCISPLAFIPLWGLASILIWIFKIPPSFLLPVMLRFSVNISIICLQVVGLALYLLGYRREEMKSGKVSHIKLFSSLLLSWGLINSYLPFFFYFIDVLPWSQQAGVNELTKWHYPLEYITWAIAGGLWIASGFVFRITSNLHKRVEPKRVGERN